MKHKPFSVLRHAFKMVKRNIRSYAMLSVTIILSFTILLGFMGYMDTEHYNGSKHVLIKDRNILSFDTAKLSTARIMQLQKTVEAVGTTHIQQTRWIGITLDTYGWELTTGVKFYGGITGTAYCLPRECWFLQERGSILQDLQATVPTWLDGRETTNITLEKGQILIDEQLYKAMDIAAKNNQIELSFFLGNTSHHHTGKFTVVGTIPSSAPLQIEIKENKTTGEKLAQLNGIDYTTALVFSLDDLNPIQYPSSEWHHRVVFYSDQPENVREALQSLEPELPIQTIYEGQNNALKKMQTEKGTKAIIAALLLVILGINLYSCFENALNDRKFEIGVKRAMGASGFSIVRQFFYESIIVMTANIAISVVLVVDLGILLMLFREATYRTEIAPNQVLNNIAYIDYILYITPYSVGMFAVCAVVLTVVFSLVFAYKTTQVQIVDYLKAE